MKKKRDGRYGTVEVMKRIGISSERLRYWGKLGFIKPEYIQCGIRKFRRYSEEDIHRAILVKVFVDTERYTLEGAIRKLKEEER